MLTVGRVLPPAVPLVVEVLQVVMLSADELTASRLAPPIPAVPRSAANDLQDKDRPAVAHGHPQAMANRPPQGLQARQPKVLQARQPQAMRDRQPQAVRDRQPQAVRDRQPQAVRDRQPQAVRDRQPQAVRDRARVVPWKTTARVDPREVKPGGEPPAK
ncbi:UNVERIFIED_CONTAM: hypothetical protein FKN15_023946 [Acipenser sinensis]